MKHRKTSLFFTARLPRKSASRKLSLSNRVLFFVASVLALLASSSVMAGPITIPTSTPTLQLTSPDTLLSAYPSPYASMWISLDSAGTTATITVEGLSNASYDYLLGGEGVVDLNVNGAYTYNTGSFLENQYSGFTAQPTDYPLVSSKNVSSFGDFNFVMDFFDGYEHAAKAVQFSLTKTTGTWSSAFGVLSLNNDGNLAAGHIFVCSATCTSSGAALLTGYAGQKPNLPPGTPNTFTSVPTPSTLVLLSTTLFSVGLVRRRRLSQRVD